MAHELEICADGAAAMMYVGETPWHGLGTKLDKPPTVEDAIAAARLDWRVELRELFISEIVRDADGADVEVMRHVPGANATVRTDSGLVLGTVGSRYLPLQNVDAFRWFQPWLDSGAATLETAGSLHGGRHVWVLARLAIDPVEVLPGDPVAAFAMLSHCHTGDGAIHAGFSGVRVVCQNTLNAAHEHSSSKFLRVAHTQGAAAALESVRDSMDLARREFAATGEVMRQMVDCGVDEADVERYVREVFELPGVGHDEGAQTVKRVQALTTTGIGTSIPGVRGTLWGAYNAVTEFLTWHRGRSRDNRMANNWIKGDAVRRAYQVALRMLRGRDNE